MYLTVEVYCTLLTDAHTHITAGCSFSVCLSSGIFVVLSLSGVWCGYHLFPPSLMQHNIEFWTKHTFLWETPAPLEGNHRPPVWIQMFNDTSGVVLLSLMLSWAVFWPEENGCREVCGEMLCAVCAHSVCRRRRLLKVQISEWSWWVNTRSCHWPS